MNTGSGVIPWSDTHNNCSQRAAAAGWTARGCSRARHARGVVRIGSSQQKTRVADWGYAVSGLGGPRAGEDRHYLSWNGARLTERTFFSCEKKVVPYIGEGV